MRKKKRNGRRKSCTQCGKLFHKKGLHNHIRACEKKPVAGDNFHEEPKKSSLVLTDEQIRQASLAQQPTPTYNILPVQRFPYAEICCIQCGQAMEIMVINDVIKIVTSRKTIRIEADRL